MKTVRWCGIRNFADHRDYTASLRGMQNRSGIEKSAGAYEGGLSWMVSDQSNGHQITPKLQKYIYIKVFQSMTPEPMLLKVFELTEFNGE